MKKLIFTITAALMLTSAVFAQKGVDKQTEKITESTGTNDNTNVSRSWNWGKDKTKVRERLANPYKLASRRDMLVENVMNVLKEMRMVVDETASRPTDGVIITQPYVFAKGAVISKNELNRYAILPNSKSVWRSGRFSLRIDIESLDGIQNNVSVTAKVDGKSETGIVSEWTSLQTSGAAEEEFLIKLVEMVTGKMIDDPKN
jgi:hypothetical protein